MDNEKFKLLKRQKLRNNEYYNTQRTFDLLYMQSKNNCKFKNLYNYIIEANNILLAYRNIKNNKGSKTKGTDNENIDDYKNLRANELVELIQNKISNYQPRSVRRVMIPKANGKLRPLGIPCFIDRIIQQCILQVLEPICEAKFYAHSYGFRPNRSTKHAYSRVATLVNRAGNHYCVDIDISSFFDNVNHGKLLKQMWYLGIRDKRVLSIISKILKAEIDGLGIQSKGTPQGGILSPLLSNIVLNELDWWIAKQWEYAPTKRIYSSQGKKYRSLKNTKMKEIWIVRYADDFKILCKNKSTANKIFHATKMWLKERLGLNISEEKSHITNLKKNYSEFLGIKFKLRKKYKKYVVKSRVCDKAYKNIQNNLSKQIIKMQRNANAAEVIRYNAMVLGVQNYYNMATDITVDFGKINYVLNRKIYNRIGKFIKYNSSKTPLYKHLYNGCNAITKEYEKVLIFPLGFVRNKPPMNFSQNICNYTNEGREIIHKELYGVDNLIKHLLSTVTEYTPLELLDNMISRICAQNGKCGVLSKQLKPMEMECHHIIPKNIGGNNHYDNLIWIHKDIHKIIHAINNETVSKYIAKHTLTTSQLRKINRLRLIVGNCKL